MSYKVFDEYAEHYDSWYYRNRFAAESEVLVLERIGVGNPALEVGVGSGFFSRRLGVDFGVDPSTRMLLIASERGVECVRGVGEKLPFRNSGFKTVVLIATLCFMENPTLGVREAYRILKPKGNVVACIVPRDSCWGRVYKLKALEGHPIYRVARFYSVREVSVMLEEQGFRVERLVATLRGCPPAEGVEEPDTPSLEEAEDYGFVCIEGVKQDMIG